MTPAAAPGTVRGWCYAAGVPPRNALVFTRLLRAIRIAARLGGDPADFLDTSGGRTMCRLLDRAGFGRPQDFQSLTIADFCRRQRLVLKDSVLREVRSRVDRDRWS